MNPAQTWRSASGDYTVHLGDGFIREASRLAHAKYPTEVGTPLVGQYSDNGSEATVSAIAPVSRDSRGSRSTFKRGVVGLREFFSRLFQVSQGRVHYVGEWHSHPGGAPFPSHTDDVNMQAIANDPRARCPECILVLLEVEPEDIQLAVYVYSSSRGRLILQRVSTG